MALQSCICMAHHQIQILQINDKECLISCNGYNECSQRDETGSHEDHPHREQQHDTDSLLWPIQKHSWEWGIFVHGFDVYMLCIVQCKRLHPCTGIHAHVHMQRRPSYYSCGQDLHVSVKRRFWCLMILIMTRAQTEECWAKNSRKTFSIPVSYPKFQEVNRPGKV